MAEQRASIGFKDRYMLEGARAAAKEQGKSLSEYVTELIGADLKKRLGYRITAHYSNGKTHEESDFYSRADLMESVHAYRTVWKEGKPTYDGALLTAFEVYEHDKIIEQQGEQNAPGESSSR